MPKLPANGDADSGREKEAEKSKGAVASSGPRKEQRPAAENEQRDSSDAARDGSSPRQLVSQERESGRNTRKSPEESNVEPHPVSRARSAAPEVHDGAEREDREIRKELSNYEEISANLQRRMLKATWAVAVVTAIYAAITGALFYIGNRQLSEMRESGKDTHALADAAQRQALSAQLQAIEGAMNAIAQLRTADAAKTSADNSNKLAQAAYLANAQARDLFQKDQRARVIVQGSTRGQLKAKPITDRLPMFTPVHIDLLIANVGKTPAKNVRICASAILVDESVFASGRPSDVDAYLFSQARGFEADCARFLEIVTGNTSGSQRLLPDRRILQRQDAERSLPIEYREVPQFYPTRSDEPLALPVGWYDVRVGVHVPPVLSGQFRMFEDRIYDFADPTIYFLVIARIAYVDTFGHAHNFGYCGKWRPPSDRLAQWPTGNFEN